jgi:hypothetical protein
MMQIEHLFALLRGLCGTDQRAEALENGFRLSVLRAKYRLDPVPPSRWDHGSRRELCEDVTFMPLSEDFQHAPFGVVQSPVQGAMVDAGVPSRALMPCLSRTRQHRLSFTTW